MAPARSLWFRCRSTKIRDLSRPRRSQKGDRKSAALHTHGQVEELVSSFPSLNLQSETTKEGNADDKIQRGFHHFVPPGCPRSPPGCHQNSPSRISEAMELKWLRWQLPNSTSRSNNFPTVKTREYLLLGNTFVHRGKNCVTLLILKRN